MGVGGGCAMTSLAMRKSGIICVTVDMSKNDNRVKRAAEEVCLALGSSGEGLQRREGGPPIVLVKCVLDCLAYYVVSYPWDNIMRNSC